MVCLYRSSPIKTRKTLQMTHPIVVRAFHVQTFLLRCNMKCIYHSIASIMIAREHSLKQRPSEYITKKAWGLTNSIHWTRYMLPNTICTNTSCTNTHVVMYCLKWTQIPCCDLLVWNKYLACSSLNLIEWQMTWYTAPLKFLFYIIV